MKPASDRGAGAIAFPISALPFVGLLFRVVRFLIGPFVKLVSRSAVVKTVLQRPPRSSNVSPLPANVVLCGARNPAAPVGGRPDCSSAGSGGQPATLRLPATGTAAGLLGR